VVLSGLIHLALLAAFFAPSAKSGAQSGVQAQGSSQGRAIAVSLVRLPSPPVAAASSSALSALESLRQQLQPSTPPSASVQPSPAPRTDAAAILAAFDHRQPTQKAAVSNPASLRAGQGGGAANPIDDPLARASVSPGSLHTKNAAQLWTQVLRCWRPDAVKSVEVRLSVSLDDRGELAAAPEVIGDTASRTNPDRAAAQAQAIRAVINCAPYAFSPGRAELDFGPGHPG
jgi:hypothetical protein